MRTLMIVPLAAIAALVACGPSADEAAPDNASAAAPVENGAAGQNVSATVLGFNDQQRNATFIRAIRDAALPCEHVASSTRIDDQDGVPTWRVTCDDGANYMVGITSDGTARILSRTGR